MALSDLFTDIADAIRDKDGTTEKIVARDFPERIAAIPSSSNQNLLDNWYFADPINQRGQTEYFAEGYTIDRWSKFYPGWTLTLTPNGLNIPAGNKIWFVQYLEHDYFNQTVTASVLLSDGKLVTSSGVLDENFENAMINDAVSLEVLHENGKMAFRLVSYSDNPTQLTVYAVKLELGSQQTLARQNSDGNWVLNDPPPNKTLELLKCQRYQFVVKTVSGNSSVVGIGTYRTSGSVLAFINIPVPLRTLPSINKFDSFVFDIDGSEFISYEYSVSSISSNAIAINVSASIPDSYIGIPGFLRTNSASTVYVFDANL